MRRFILAAVSCAALALSAVAANAGVVIVVNKSTQRLSVSVDGVPRYEWAVSTARMGYNTPNGTYGVERMEVQWFSRKYDWSPMPHSIFFNGGYAIHGSYEIGRLGTPASHGCIRLHPNNATILYRLVEANRHSTRIVVTGDGSAPMASGSGHRPRYAADDNDQPPRRGYADEAPGYDGYTTMPRRYARPPAYVDGDDNYAPPQRRYRRARGFDEIFN